MENFVGVEDAARFLGVKVSYLYEKVRLRLIPSYKIGAFRRFRLSELEAWVKEQGQEGGTPPADLSWPAQVPPLTSCGPGKRTGEKARETKELGRAGKQW